MWSLGKKLRNTFLQQVISVLALCSAWCFTPNSLIQLFFEYLEDPDIKQEPRNSLFRLYSTPKKTHSPGWTLDTSSIILIFNTFIYLVFFICYLTRSKNQAYRSLPNTSISINNKILFNSLPDSPITIKQIKDVITKAKCSACLRQIRKKISPEELIEDLVQRLPIAAQPQAVQLLEDSPNLFSDFNKFVSTLEDLYFPATNNPLLAIRQLA